MFLVLLFSNFWIKSQLVVTLPAVCLFDWLINDGKQHIFAQSIHWFERDQTLRKQSSELLSICDASVPPCGRIWWCDRQPFWIKRTFLLLDFSFVTVTYRSPKSDKLQITGCKSSPDRNICSDLFISWLTWRGKLKHLFTQLSLGFCLMQMLQSSKKEKKERKKSHEAAYMNRPLNSQRGDSTVGTSVSQHTGPNQNRTLVPMYEWDSWKFDFLFK